MKKLLAVLLTVVMLFAVCVPAFAAELNKDNTSDTVIIKTSTQREGQGDGEDASSYSVSIPAETVISWGKDSTDLTYTIVKCQLLAGQTLTVEATGSGSMKSGDLAPLAYTLADTSYTTPVNTVVNGKDCALKVNIAEADWDNAIIAEYQDTLTFTATVNG